MLKFGTMMRGAIAASALMLAATPALAGDKDRARAAIAEAQGKIDAARRVDASTVAPEGLAKAEASLKLAQEQLKNGKEQRALESAMEAQAAADGAIGRTQANQAMTSDANAAVAADAQAQAADANARAAAAEQAAASAQADAAAARAAPPVVVAPAPQPAPTTTVTTETVKSTAPATRTTTTAARKPAKKVVSKTRTTAARPATTSEKTTTTVTTRQ